jgi:hypothetical protein
MLACNHAAMQPRLPGIVRSSARSSRATDKEPLQVRIPAAVKRRFKAQAAIRGMEPNELFVEVWDHYERTIIAAMERQGEKA